MTDQSVSQGFCVKEELRNDYVILNYFIDRFIAEFLCPGCVSIQR
jgi:hypothetical protein